MHSLLLLLGLVKEKGRLESALGWFCRAWDRLGDDCRLIRSLLNRNRLHDLSLNNDWRCGMLLLRLRWCVLLLRIVC